MEGACTLTARINALLSPPLCHFLKLDVKPARGILVVAKEVSMCSHRGAETDCSVRGAKFTALGLQPISNITLCNHLKDASIAV